MDFLNQITGTGNTYNANNINNPQYKLDTVINKLQGLTEEVKTIKDSLNSSSINDIFQSSNTELRSPYMEPTALPYMEQTASPYMEPTASPYMEQTASPYMEQTASPGLYMGSNSISSQNIMKLPISIYGYNGTVGEIVSKINTKISQLNSPLSRGRYNDKVNELKYIVNSIRNATTVNEVKSIIGNKLTFKNNNLMGGNTRKHRKGRKKGTKRH
jgi:hypothetical protein